MLHADEQRYAHLMILKRLPSVNSVQTAMSPGLITIAIGSRIMVHFVHELCGIWSHNQLHMSVGTRNLLQLSSLMSVGAEMNRQKEILNIPQ